MGRIIFVSRSHMICSQCHYQMDAFDTLCPKCHGQGLVAPVVPAIRSARPYRRWIGITSACFLVAFLGLKLAFNLYTQSQHAAVLEAVLQDVLHPQFRRESKDILFVSVYGVEASGTIGDMDDPSDSLLSRFKNEGFRVRKASQALRKKNPFWPVGSIYIDKNTGEKGARVWLGPPTWSLPLKAKVYCGGGGMGQYCIVVRKDGRWVVRERELAWIA